MKQRIINILNGLRPVNLVVRLSVLITVFVLLSCEEKKAEGVLSRDEIVKVLTEIYVAEDKVNHLSLTPDSGQKVFSLMLKRVNEKTGVSDSVFKRSMEYYIARPQEMEQIYAALVDSLNLREQRSPEMP